MQTSWERLNLGMFVVKTYTFKFKFKLALIFELPGRGMIGFLDGLCGYVCIFVRESKGGIVSGN